MKTPKELVSCHKNASIAVTNFNGDGGEHSQPEKRRVEDHRVVKTPKELVSCHKNASIAEIHTENITVGERGGEGTYTLKTTSKRSRRGVESPDKCHKNS